MGIFDIRMYKNAQKVNKMCVFYKNRSVNFSDIALLFLPYLNKYMKKLQFVD